VNPTVSEADFTGKFNSASFENRVGAFQMRATKTPPCHAGTEDFTVVGMLSMYIRESPPPISLTAIYSASVGDRKSAT